MGQGPKLIVGTKLVEVPLYVSDPIIKSGIRREPIPPQSWQHCQEFEPESDALDRPGYHAFAGLGALIDVHANELAALFHAATIGQDNGHPVFSAHCSYAGHISMATYNFRAEYQRLDRVICLVDLPENLKHLMRPLRAISDVVPVTAMTRRAWFLRRKRFLVYEGQYVLIGRYQGNDRWRFIQHTLASDTTSCVYHISVVDDCPDVSYMSHRDVVDTYPRGKDGKVVRRHMTVWRGYVSRGWDSDDEQHGRGIRLPGLGFIVYALSAFYSEKHFQ